MGWGLLPAWGVCLSLGNPTLFQEIPGLWDPLDVQDFVASLEAFLFLRVDLLVHLSFGSHGWVNILQNACLDIPAA